MPPPPNNRLPRQKESAEESAEENAEESAGDEPDQPSSPAAADGQNGAASDKTEPAPDQSPPTAAQLRQQKLARIKAAVDAGLYDSDELLHLAMGRMLNAIDDEDDHPHKSL